jgi:hypothetical protein
MPADQRCDELPHSVAAERKRTEFRELLLESFDRAFHDRDAAMLADSAPTGFDAVALAPLLVAGTRPKLAAFVAGQVLWRFPRGANHAPQKGPHFNGRWRAAEEREAHDPSRIVVDDDGQPTAEGGMLWIGKRPPRAPQPHQHGDGRQIDVQHVVGALGGDDAALALTPTLSHREREILCFREAFRGERRFRFLVPHPPDCRGAQMQPGARQHFGQLLLPQRGAQRLDSLHGIPHEIRELIHRCAQLHQRVGAVLIQPVCIDVLDKPVHPTPPYLPLRRGGGIHFATTILLRHAIAESPSVPQADKTVGGAAAKAAEQKVVSGGLAGSLEKARKAATDGKEIAPGLFKYQEAEPISGYAQHHLWPQAMGGPKEGWTVFARQPHQMVEGIQGRLNTFLRGKTGLGQRELEAFGRANPEQLLPYLREFYKKEGIPFPY